MDVLHIKMEKKVSYLTYVLIYLNPQQLGPFSDLNRLGGGGA